jgi:hypothetical protein
MDTLLYFKHHLEVLFLHYITSVSGDGTPGQAGSYRNLTINLTAPSETIKYNCSNHNGMGADIIISAEFC